MSFKPRVVLYGPPGVGKSTMLRNVLSIDDEILKFANVVDLENIPVPLRPKAVLDIYSWNYHGPLFVGAAELYPPEHFAWDKWQIVGLIPNDKDAYLKRVERRNKLDPHKANQNESYAYDVISNHVKNNRSKMACIVDPLEFEGRIEPLWRHIFNELTPK